MKITVLGTGYVGFLTGVCLSDVLMNLTCAYIDSKIDRYNLYHIAIMTEANFDYYGIEM